MTEILILGLLFLAIGIVIMFIGLAWLDSQEFRHNIKPGDRVIVYRRNDKVPATVRSIDGKEVTVVFRDGTQMIVDILLIHKPE